MNVWRPQIYWTVMTPMKKLTLKLSNPCSGEGEGEGVRVGAAHGSHHLWLWSQPHQDAQSWSWCDVQWVCLSSSMHSLALRSLSSCGNPSWLQNLSGSNASGCEWGCPGPLASRCHLVMAWVISHQPSCKLNVLVLSWKCLPTQLMALNNINMASYALPRLSP